MRTVDPLSRFRGQARGGLGAVCADVSFAPELRAGACFGAAFDCCRCTLLPGGFPRGAGFVRSTERGAGECGRRLL